MEEAQYYNFKESHWVEMARAGDLAAFNQLVLSSQDAAFRMANWLLNDEAGAQDIVQTVFLAAYCRMDSFRSNHFRAWLFRMLHNACIDELRRRKRHPCLSLISQEAGEETAQIERWSVDTEPWPEEALIQREAWDWIEQCLRQLPEPMREVMILIDIESFDYAEAASIVGVPLGTIKSRLGRLERECASCCR